jgi:hypothetical protein
VEDSSLSLYLQAKHCGMRDHGALCCVNKNRLLDYSVHSNYFVTYTSHLSSILQVVFTVRFTHHILIYICIFYTFYNYKPITFCGLGTRILQISLLHNHRIHPLFARIPVSRAECSEDFCLLGYNAVYSVESQPMFRRNMLSPSSHLKVNQSKRPA